MNRVYSVGDVCTCLVSPASLWDDCNAFIYPVEASECFLSFLCNFFSCFTTAKITFTSIFYPHFI